MENGLEISIGLLSGNNELISDFYSNIDGFRVNVCKSVEMIRSEDFKLLIIDIDVFESDELVQFYLSKIRKKLQGLPVLLILRVGFLSSLNMEWFFDEFILYPFRKGELSARIKRLLWDKNLLQNENILVIGNLKVDISGYSVFLNNEKLDLTYKEFELLRLFIQNRGVVFSRKDLLEVIWGVEYIGGTRTVDVHIRRLRGKLGDEFNTIIETVRNVGYKCREPSEIQDNIINDLE